MLEDENDSPKETQLTTEEEKKEEEEEKKEEEDDKKEEKEPKEEENKTENFEKTEIPENKSEKIKENEEDIKIEKKTKIDLNENDDKEEISTSKKNDLNEIKKNSEIETNSNKNYINNLFIPDQTYDLLLDDNGNPNLSENSIFVIDNNSELNIKIMNNIKISNELNLVSNCYKEFPNLNFEEELKPYIKIEKKNIDLMNEEEIELPLNKVNDYIIEPDKVNIMIYFRVQFIKSGIYTFYLLYREKDTRKYKLTFPFKILVNPIFYLGKDEKKMKK